MENPYENRAQNFSRLGIRHFDISNDNEGRRTPFLQRLPSAGAATATIVNSATIDFYGTVPVTGPSPIFLGVFFG